jgi:hypothetical protein
MFYCPAGAWPDARMVFVPEGQHDSSQARSAWNHQEFPGLKPWAEPSCPFGAQNHPRQPLTSRHSAQGLR